MIEDGTINLYAVALLVSLYLFIGFLCALTWWFVGNGRKKYKKAVNEVEHIISTFGRSSLYESLIDHYENKAEGYIGLFILICLFWPIGWIVATAFLIVLILFSLYEGTVWILKRTIGR